MEKKPVVCFLYRKTGHIARECRGANGPKQKAATILSHNRGWQKRVRKPSREIQSENGGGCKQVQARLKVIDDITENGSLKLASGKAVSVIVEACDEHTKEAELDGVPVERGYMGNQEVQVLRDTGCSLAAIKQQPCEA